MRKTVYSMKFGAGEVIFRIGDRGQNAYFIETGRVEISIERDGGKIVVARLGEGEIFGEMSMIDDAPRSATVTALEDTEVIVIEHSRMRKPLSSIDPMMNLLLRVILTRFRDSQAQMSGLRAKSGAGDLSLEEIRKLAFDRINAERRLRDALEAGEFEMHYQPIADLDRGHIAGFEALVRWRKPDGGFIAPFEFIPLAEETGMIVELGRWILETSLNDQLALKAAAAEALPGVAAPFMSINISGVQLSDMLETQRLMDMVADSGVEPEHVKLEITETLMVENAEQAATALGKLREAGCSIAIDDFGTGYSSLSYLHRFPLDTLKIDRTFVNNMGASENGRRIVISIIQLARALGLGIVAEGIEDRAQLDKLRELGCAHGQGYFMARPMPLADVIDLVKSAPVWR